MWPTSLNPGFLETFQLGNDQDSGAFCVVDVELVSRRRIEISCLAGCAVPLAESERFPSCRERIKLTVRVKV
jgi:hypothetical protein